MDQQTTVKKYSIGLYILSAIIGGFFLFSAFSKTQPIESFEVTLKTQLLFSSFSAAYWARFFIGLEAALGFLLLINVFGISKWVIKASFWLTVIFTVHLIFIYFNIGNDISCGCMGDLVPLKPLPSIGKNIILLLLLGVLWKYTPNNNSQALQWTAIAIMVAFVVSPFLLFKYDTKVLPLSRLYNTEPKHIPTEELRQGKHMVAFLSLTCSHCRHAAGIMTKMKEQDSSLPIYILFGEMRNDSLQQDVFKEFVKETHFEGLPYSYIDRDNLLKFTGGSVPAIFWLNDTTIVRELTVNTLNLKEFQLWLK